MKKVSIVVPIYNVEEYLEQCINSLINQTYSNIEILLIDDGSTDNSKNICDTYSSNDKIHVFHKPNGGLSDARNYGVNVSSGDYIMFVDSDDLVSNNIVEKLVKLIEKDNFDISIVDVLHFYDNNKFTYSNLNNTKIYNKKDALLELLYQNSFLVTACAKLYKKELFENILFPKGKRFEDSAIMYKLFDKSNNIIYNNSKLYAYRHRQNSITTVPFSKKDLDIISISDEMFNYFISSDEDIKNAALVYKYNSYLRIYLNATNEFKDEKKHCEEFLKKYSFKVFKNRKIRKKLRIAILLFVFSKKLLKKVYSRTDRWK